MRPVFLLLLVLLMPLSTAFLTVNVESPSSVVEGEEIEITLEEGYWTQANWNELKNNGVSPLRVISPSTLLAWSDLEEIVLDLPVEIVEAQSAQYKAGLDGLQPRDGDVLRLVLEPRLPEMAAQQLSQQLAFFSIEMEFDNALLSSPIPYTMIVEWNYDDAQLFSQLLEIDGILWIEPVLATYARNTQSASIHQYGGLSKNPAWDLGLNASGVVVAMADSGIDADHSCFRNATAVSQLGSDGENGTDAEGLAGLEHRKLLLLNETIDSGDTQGHSDYRHGTHVAGTLSCFDVYDYRNNTIPNTGSSLAHGSTLIFQDVVSSEGWVVPDVDLLLYEAALNGAVIHSDSWGDNSAEYTARSADFDAWSREHPWSLAFIAPGNNGGEILEPANARNVAAIGASIKNNQSQRWAASAHGPLQADTVGIFALATGSPVLSAKADGIDDSYNDELRLSSGTSMATPMAASNAAVIQQLVEQGWIRGSHENTHSVSVAELRPMWADNSLNTQSNLLLGDGFTPSGPMLRALMALASTPLPLDERNGGNGGQDLRNPYDGFGRLNLSQLVDFEQLENMISQGNVSPTSDVWIHDSYRLEQSPQQLLSLRNGSLSPLENLANNPWDGGGAAGPFLSSGEVWNQQLAIQQGQALDITMAFPSSPEPYLVDDMLLVVRLSNGMVAISGRVNSDGSNTLFYESAVNYSNDSSFPQSNETTMKIHLDAEDIIDVEWIEIEVRARYVSPGNSPGTVGIDGNKNGFSIAAKGVLRDYDGWLDGDGDGIVNAVDLCPIENASGFDIDLDGCLDDSDGDTITDNVDLCVDEDASGFDIDLDGCIDDSDGDSVKDNVDLCHTEIINSSWPVMQNGCRPIDESPQITIITELENGSVWEDIMLVRWVVQDPDDDPISTGVKLMIFENNSSVNSSELIRCVPALMVNSTDDFFCIWVIPNNLPSYDINERQLHLEFFAYSLNQSPAANNELITKTSGNTFTSSWHNASSDDYSNPSISNENEIAKQKMILMMGILGLVGSLVCMVVVAKSHLQNASKTAFSEDNEGGLAPIDDGAA
ncbi:MAG: S8 family serine peptidase [Candidatus Poseidoniaceae archaeon]|nr:S8 family serine peptidase [Candidatus Poseidoniaceae archaeon]